MGPARGLPEFFHSLVEAIERHLTSSSSWSHQNLKNPFLTLGTVSNALDHRMLTICLYMKSISLHKSVELRAAQSFTCDSSTCTRCCRTVCRPVLVISLYLVLSAVSHRSCFRVTLLFSLSFRLLISAPLPASHKQITQIG